MHESHAGKSNEKHYSSFSKMLDYECEVQMTVIFSTNQENLHENNFTNSCLSTKRN